MLARAEHIPEWKLSLICCCADVLQTREALIDESFSGRSVLPANWNHPRHPIVVDAGKETKTLAKWNIVKAPGYQERYGVKSIVSRLKQLYPQVTDDSNFGRMLVVVFCRSTLVPFCIFELTMGSMFSSGRSAMFRS